MRHFIWAVAMAAALESTILAAGAGNPAATTATHPVSTAASPEASGRPARLDLKSNVALVFDEAHGQTLYAKNPDRVVPIASITKLMTAMVVLDAGLPLDQEIRIESAEVKATMNTRSRLPVGTRLSRGDLLWVALMSSENRAAAALARTFPGGTAAFVEAMNRKGGQIGMSRSRFADPTGLSSGNVASAEDLSRMVRAAMGYPAIREFSTTAARTVTLRNGRALAFHNSNGLVSNKTWSIGLSKTGYISAAGRCLVMQARIAARPVIIVLLDSFGKYTRQGDANRIRKWMEAAVPSVATAISSTGAPVPAAAPAAAPAGPATPSAGSH